MNDERFRARVRQLSPFGGLAAPWGCSIGRAYLAVGSSETVSLFWIVEEELIAVGIVDHQQPISPRTLLDRSAFGLEFRAQRIQRRRRSFPRLGLHVQGNDHHALADLLRPCFGQDQGAALPIDLCDISLAVLVEAPGNGEAELLHIKAQRRLNITHVQDGAREPLCHTLCLLRAIPSSQDNCGQRFSVVIPRPNRCTPVGSFGGTGGRGGSAPPIDRRTRSLTNSTSRT